MLSSVSTPRRARWEPGRRSEGEWGVNDPRFARLDDATIQRALAHFDNDAWIQTAYNISLNALLSGNILFRHHTDTNRYKDSDEDQRWLSQTYGGLCREIVRHLWAIGFVAVTYVAHPIYVAEPTCLNLERCEIYHFKDIYGKSHFRFFERIEVGSHTGGTPTVGVGAFFLNMGTGIQVDVNRREIPNVTVFCTDPPSNEGHLRSRIMLLAPDMIFESHLYSCCVEADLHRSNPPMITTRANTKADSKALTVTDRMDIGGRGTQSVFNGTGTQEGPLRQSQWEQMQAEEAHMRHVAALVEQGFSRGDLDADHMIKKRKLVHGHVMREIQLETDREYVRHVLPESPHEMLLKFRAARMEKILALFSMPVGMISQQSSIGSRTSMNENAYVVYLDAQKQLKQLLLSYVYEIYRHIYDVTNAYDYIVKTMKEKKEAPSAEGMYAAMHCEITMPGLPPEAVMERLYLLGLFKYESYVEFLHSKHAIPRTDFNPKPELTLQEMNQIKPPEGEDGSGRTTKSS